MTAIEIVEVVSTRETTSSDTLDHAFCAVCYPPPYEQNAVLVSFCGKLRDEHDPIGVPVRVACVICYSTEVCPRCGTEFEPEVTL